MLATDALSENARGDHVGTFYMLPTINHQLQYIMWLNCS